MESKELKNLIERYILFMDNKEITKNSYEGILYKFCDYISKKTSNPKRDDLLKYKSYLLKTVGAATVQKNIVVLRGFYLWIQMNGGENLMIGIKGCKVSSDFKRQALTIKDSSKLLDYAKKKAQKSIQWKRTYAMAALMLTTGLRSIEVHRSDITDIDKIGGERVLFVMGKGHDSKDTHVKLSPETLEALENYLNARDDEEEAMFVTHNKKGKAARLSLQAIRMDIKELLIAIGYNSRAYSVHSLRHTFATTALSVGASLMETKEAMRHKNVGTTQIYLHNVEQMNSSTNNKVSDAVFGKTKKKG